jgi:hypothetical protein
LGDFLFAKETEEGEKGDEDYNRKNDEFVLVVSLPRPVATPSREPGRAANQRCRNR